MDLPFTRRLRLSSPGELEAFYFAYFPPLSDFHLNFLIGNSHENSDKDKLISGQSVNRIEGFSKEISQRILIPLVTIFKLFLLARIESAVRPPTHPAPSKREREEGTHG